MKKIIILFAIIALMTASIFAKPHCQSFNNYDNKVTIGFTDDDAGSNYNVTDVKLIPSSWGGKEYPATSVRFSVDNGVATVTLEFKHLTHFSNPKVTMRVNGKKKTFKVCQ